MPRQWTEKALDNLERRVTNIEETLDRIPAAPTTNGWAKVASAVTTILGGLSLLVTPVLVAALS